MNKKESISSDKVSTFKQQFSIQLIKYWKYAKKWFPFALLIGGICGVLMALFTSLIVNLQVWIDFLPSEVKYFVFFPLVGGFTSFLLYRGFTEVKGAGMSYVLAHKNTSTPLKPRTLLTKFVTSVLTLSVSAPAGREGPAVTLGSTASSVIGDKLGMTKEDEMHAITIGAAACTAAVFRAPLGGTVFASEVPYKHDLDETVFLPALVSSGISFLVYDAILNAIRNFSAQPIYLSPISTDYGGEIIKYAHHFIFIGLIAGILGIGFSLLFKLLSKKLEKYLKAFLLPVIGMLITAVIVFLIDKFYFEPSNLPGVVTLSGTGFRSITTLLDNYGSISFTVILALLLGKILVTSTCIGFGNSAGVMGPSLVTGAALGFMYATLFQFPEEVAIAMMVIGMSAMHTATTKTPIASMILVLEIVGFPNLIIPIILSNAVAFLFSLDFSLYKGQIQSKEVILRRTIQNTDILELITVKEAMDKNAPNIKESDLLEETFSLLASNRRSALTVVDENGELCGIISTSDFHNGIFKGKKYVHEAMTKDLICVYPNEKLSSAFDKLTEYRIEYLPVVEPSNQKKILGVISFIDIENFYEEELIKIKQKNKVTIEDILNEV
ncbi:MAG: chloride channel protein [Candidatus Thorarchaeota archaeon]